MTPKDDNKDEIPVPAQSVLLIRIDERVKLLSGEVKELNNKMESMQNDLDDKIQSMQSIYVTRKEFEPVKIITYGIVGISLVTLLGAMLAKVIM